MDFVLAGGEDHDGAEIEVVLLLGTLGSLVQVVVAHRTIVVWIVGIDDKLSVSGDETVDVAVVLVLAFGNVAAGLLGVEAVEYVAQVAHSFIRSRTLDWILTCKKKQSDESHCKIL